MTIDSWTPQERWVWNTLCSHQDADLAKFDNNPNIDPGKDWPETRILRADFIETILTAPDFIDKLANRAVTIVHAKVTERVRLPAAKLPALFLQGSRLEGGVDLQDAEVGGAVSFARSWVLGGDVSLNGAKVGGVILRDGAYESLDLIQAEIGGNVALEGSYVINDLKIDGAEVKGAGQLYNSRFGGVVSSTGATFNGGLLMSGSKFDKDLKLSGLQVKDQVDLSNAELYGNVDLEAAVVDGSLILFSNGKPPQWHSQYLSLRGARLKGIDDDEAKSWPANVQLSGLVLEQAQSRGYASRSFLDRQAEWYIGWLGRSEGFPRQLYSQLETTLRSAGRTAVANEIGMERAAREYSSYGGIRRVFGPIHWLLVGYGYQPERAIFFIVGFTILGFAVIRLGIRREELARQRIKSPFVLSTHRLIPLISFGKSYEEFDFNSRRIENRYVRRYFVVHAVVGYVLAAALVTALAGVTSVTPGK